MFIHVKVKAGSKKEEFYEKDGNHFELSVREEAERNRANERVIELIAFHFKIPTSYVRIINGHHSPSKLLSIKDD